MSYRELEIYQIATELFYEAHRYSLLLPKFETYEQGSQLRRAADSVGTNIVEGYGRKRYKKDFIRFLIFSHASNDETIHHLNKIIHLYPEFNDKFVPLVEKFNVLGAKINKFINYVDKNWRDGAS